MSEPGVDLDKQPDHGRLSLDGEGARRAAPVDDVSAQLRTIEQRAYKTYKCRMMAEHRLRLRNHAWNASMISTTAAAVIASIAVLSSPDIYGKAGGTLLVCISVLTLTATLVTSGLDYSGRSRSMFVNYRRIQQLSVEAERAANTPASWTSDVLIGLSSRYQSLLDESENHTGADFAAAFPDENRKAHRVTGEQLVSSLPYLCLLIPVGLVIPLAVWIAHGFQS
jgi:hypothetical protein